VAHDQDHLAFGALDQLFDPILYRGLTGERPHLLDRLLFGWLDVV
jgi:hypothetical protein